VKRREVEQQSKRRLSPAFAISLGVHLILAIVMLRLLVVPNLDFFAKKRGTVAAQQLGFLRLAKTPGKEPTPGRDGGNGRPVSRTVAPRLVAPSSVPTTIPTVTPSATPSKTDEGTGPLVGDGGPARGIKPVFSDPRLWGPPGKIVSAPRTLKQDLDSMIASGIGRYNDSIAAIPATPRWENGDWTVEHNGRKYGIDPQFIRLGPVSIPTALLAMLPLNLTGNPTVQARNRALNYQHRDITEHAEQAINEADFNKAVRSIRERKERERAAAGGTAADSTTH
jgi:hypothetical protein